MLFVSRCLFLCRVLCLFVNRCFLLVCNSYIVVVCCCLIVCLSVFFTLVGKVRSLHAVLDHSSFFPSGDDMTNAVIVGGGCYTSTAATATALFLRTKMMGLILLHGLPENR